MRDLVVSLPSVLKPEWWRGRVDAFWALRRSDQVVLVVSAIVALLSLNWGIGAIRAFPRATIDDAYIIFRYAENILRHGQPVWTIDAPRVEGFTGQLLLVIYTALLGLRLTPDAAALLAGVFGYILTLFSMLLLVRRFGRKAPLSMALTVAIFTTTPFIYMHVVGGLETLLYAGVLVGFLATLHHALMQGSPRAQHEASIAGLIAAITRPEGVLALIIAPVCVVGERLLVGDRVGARQAAVRMIRSGWLPFLLFSLIRSIYYGDFLSNAYHVKAGEFFLPEMNTFKAFVWEGLFTPTVVTVAIVLAVWWLARRVPMPKHRDASTRAALFVLVAAVVIAFVPVFVYVRSVLVMNYSYRFYIPTYAVALAVLMAFTARAETRFALRGSFSAAGVGSRVVGVMLALVAAYFALAQITVDKNRHLVEEMEWGREYKLLMDTEHVPLGKWLKGNLPEGEWVVVIEDAGAVPYYSQRPCIDWGALNDRIITAIDLDLRAGRITAEKAYDRRFDYVFSYMPGAFVMTSIRPDYVARSAGMPPGSAPPDALLADPRMQGYSQVKTWTGGTGYYLILFLRNDIVGKVAL